MEGIVTVLCGSLGCDSSLYHVVNVEVVEYSHLFWRWRDL